MAALTNEDVIRTLFDIQAVKFGDFKLKSGIQSPVYFDLRVLVSYPKLMSQVSELLWESGIKGNAHFSYVCGVPYTALPLATCISVTHDIPMLIRRKEAKDYGTKKMIEGHFQEGQKCLVIEDVVTSGGSVAETVETLTSVGLQVTDAVVLLDREQGGRERLKESGIHLHSVFRVTEILSILHKLGKISDSIVQDVKRFLSENMFPSVQPQTKMLKENEPLTSKSNKSMTYLERFDIVSSPMAKKLIKVMDAKKTNLAFSADVTSCAELLKLAESVGPNICVLKTHVDILSDFTPDFITSLQSVAQKHNFLIFEDRKYADIGNTVKHQYIGGVYRVCDWADMINAHSVPGSGVIKGLKEASVGKERGCLLIAEMSSEGNLATGDYTKKTIDMAEGNSEFVMGFISTSAITSNPKFLHFTPGVQFKQGGDSLGQQYTTPHDAICRKGTDIIIVGRGIYKADDPAAAAKAYQEAGYKAYLEKCGS